MTCGTRTQYQRGCRCEPCVEANNEYCRRYYRGYRENERVTVGAFRIPESTRGQHGLGAGIVNIDVMASWRESAACVGINPDLWDIDQPTQWPAGAKICADCPVQQQCLKDHLNNIDAFGLYGGVPLWAGVPMHRRETKRHAG